MAATGRKGGGQRRRAESAGCDGGGIGGGGSGGCRGRGCRATCDAVTSANRPLLTLPHRTFLTPATLFSLRPFRAAHEPHPRDRTRPPNYGLEFELAVNPFIALPPPPARQPPRPAHHHSGPTLRSAPRDSVAGFSPVTYTHRTAARRRHVARCVWVYNAPCGVGATCARCAHRSRPKARITRHFFPGSGTLIRRLV